MKRRKIKLKPYDLKLRKNRGGFDMTIMATTKTNNQYEIEIDFEDWWVEHFHSSFKNLLLEKYAEALRMKALFENNEPPF